MSAEQHTSDLSVEQLLARLRLNPPVRSELRLCGFTAVQAWTNAFHILPGRSLAIPAWDLFRHFKQWCADRGHMSFANQRGFGHALKVLGFQRGRCWRDGRELRPYRTDQVSAQILRQWVEQNPTIERGFRVLRRAEGRHDDLSRTSG